jgi:hypothetical protein
MSVSRTANTTVLAVGRQSRIGHTLEPDEVSTENGWRSAAEAASDERERKPRREQRTCNGMERTPRCKGRRDAKGAESISFP